MPVRLLASLVVFIAASAQASQAAVISYAFTRHVTVAKAPDPSKGYFVGAPITGRFSYDTDIVLSQYLGGFVAFATEPNAKIEFNVKLNSMSKLPEYHSNQRVNTTQSISKANYRRPQPNP
jgi:hypothetical protein